MEKKKLLKTKIIALASILVLFITGCFTNLANHDGPPLRDLNVSKIKDAKPVPVKKSRYGNKPTYHVRHHTYHVLPTAEGYDRTGIASWYGRKFHGRRTSNGELYNMYAMTAASKTLPLPTYVEVTNLRNHKKAIVKVNDRGPFHSNRILDLSYAAAKKLGIYKTGTAKVRIRAITFHKHPKAPIKEVAINKTATPKPEKPHFLQIGAFSQRENAVKMVSKLKAMAKESVSIKEVYKEGQPTIYRVQIGPFSNRSESLKRRQSLIARGLQKGLHESIHLTV